MKKTLVVTDVTQMPQADYVCVVGVDEKGRSIRPICEGGFKKRYLTQDNRVIIMPTAKVEFDLYTTEINPPHVEDMAFSPNSIVNKGFCSHSEWEKVLQQTSFQTVEENFEGYLKNKGWVMPGSNTKSIGTLSSARIIDIDLTFESIKPRITFVDISNQEYNRPSSDLTLWNYCYFKVKKQENSRSVTEQELIKLIKSHNKLYLRLGLARPWKQDNKCWLQVTGVYTFPDYLQGKTFADF
jgi:hypothetical protein